MINIVRVIWKRFLNFIFFILDMISLVRRVRVVFNVLFENIMGLENCSKMWYCF